LQTLADQIAIALDNARSFERTQAALREVESMQARYAGQVWRAAATVQESRAFEYTRSGVLLPDDQLLQESDRVIGADDANVTSDDGDNQMPSSLVVPLELYGQTIGVLGFQEAGLGRVWTEDEVALAKAAAYEIAQVLESAHLFEEVKKRAWWEQTVGQITARIHASTSLEGILKTAAEELGRTLGVSRAIVRLRPQETADQTSEEALS